MLPTLRRALLPVLIGLSGCMSEEVPIGSESFGITQAVEQWRKLVEKYFKYQHVTWALNIMQCESGGNPNAYNAGSGASGLFQHLAKYWPPRATAAGFPGASVFDGEANIAASAWLLYQAGPGQWSCKYSPYEDFNYQPQFYKNGVPVGPAPDPTPTPDTSPPKPKPDTSQPKKDAGSKLPAADSHVAAAADGEVLDPTTTPDPEPQGNGSTAKSTPLNPDGGLVGGCSVGGGAASVGALLPLLLLVGIGRRKNAKTPRRQHSKS
jgi:MYXO-CTERM domain-containing protein